jgi:serine/threonine protein phosphatase PrpC
MHADEKTKGKKTTKTAAKAAQQGKTGTEQALLLNQNTEKETSKHSLTNTERSTRRREERGVDTHSLTQSEAQEEERRNQITHSFGGTDKIWLMAGACSWH